MAVYILIGVALGLFVALLALTAASAAGHVLVVSPRTYVRPLPGVEPLWYPPTPERAVADAMSPGAAAAKAYAAIARADRATILAKPAHGAAGKGSQPREGDSASSPVERNVATGPTVRAVCARPSPDVVSDHATSGVAEGDRSASVPPPPTRVAVLVRSAVAVVLCLFPASFFTRRWPL